MARPTVGNRPRAAKFKGEYTENRMAWVNTAIANLVMMFYPQDEESKESGPTVKILIPQQNARTVTWDLTHLTGEELEATRAFFELAFEKAKPIVELRDKVAADAFANGDDSYSRSYRQVPQFIVRKGKVEEHGEGVQHRPSDVPDPGLHGAGGDTGGVRGDRGSVAHDEQVQGEPQDDGAQTH